MFDTIHALAGIILLLLIPIHISYSPREEDHDMYPTPQLTSLNIATFHNMASPTNSATTKAPSSPTTDSSSTTTHSSIFSRSPSPASTPPTSPSTPCHTNPYPIPTNLARRPPPTSPTGKLSAFRTTLSKERRLYRHAVIQRKEAVKYAGISKRAATIGSKGKADTTTTKAGTTTKPKVTAKKDARTFLNPVLERRGGIHGPTRRQEAEAEEIAKAKMQWWSEGRQGRGIVGSGPVPGQQRRR
ncbi:hypothetical protein KVT40_007207 [Elsinoe batatas]|uniref:Uncharacterized protein n=1 Tax=Elsinoe batatas TaxID=2601811 RepID=A0A8K0PD97_9PEZI|nr:hypothetical protein KVT40_007207 [Elsinoe batatas]